MSRVQLALNVADIDAAVDFYSKLFAAEPAKRRPGYANFAIADPPLKLVLIENPAGRGEASPGRSTISASRSRPPRRCRPPPARLAGEGLATTSQETTDVLLRRAGQGVGRRPRRRAVGGLHRPAEPTHPAESCARLLHRGRVLRRPGRTGRRRPAGRAATGRAALNDAALWRRLVAEWLGSALLAAVVVGSGIAAQQLRPGRLGLELLENAAATAAGLYALILMLGPVSGAHFNPVVSFVDAAFGGLRWRDAARLPARPGRRLRRRGGAGQRDVLPAGVTISTHHRATGAALRFRGGRHRRAAAGHLRPGPHRPGQRRPGRGRRLHRRRLLLHQLHQLRQPGHHRRAHVLQHLRRDRPVVRPGVHRRPDPRWRRSAWPSSRCSTRPSPPAEAANVVIPHLTEETVVTAQARRAVPLHPQLPAAAWPPRSSSTTTPRPRRRPLRAAPSPATSSTRPSSPSSTNAASTRPRSSPSPSPTTTPGRPTWWSPWAAATPARSTPASATWTGNSPTPPVCPRRGPAHRRRHRPAGPGLAQPAGGGEHLTAAEALAPSRK